MRNCLTILLLTLSASLQAQERLTLQQAIAKALQYNYDIRVADVAAQVAAVNNTTGNAGMLPNINATGGVNAGITNAHIQFATGDEQEKRGAQTLSYNGAINLNWTLFDGGRMFLVKRQLNMQEDLGQMQLKAQVQSTVSQVIQAYAQVVWQKQQGIAIDTALVLAQVRMVLSQMKYETGASAKVDYLQAQVDYFARQSDSLNQESALNATFASLNLLMGEDPYKTFIVDDSLVVDTTLQPTDKERLEDVNLSLAVARGNAQVSELGARIAKTYHLPVVGLNGSYSYNYNKSQSGTLLFNRSDGLNGGLNVSVPLFQGGNIRRQARVASLQARRDEILYERQNTDIGRQYRTAWRNYEMSMASYRLGREAVRYARENIDIQKARFRVGIATTIETRDAENSYVLALLRFYTAAYNLKVNETILLELENQLVK